MTHIKFTYEWIDILLECVPEPAEQWAIISAVKMYHEGGIIEEDEIVDGWSKAGRIIYQQGLKMAENDNRATLVNKKRKRG